MKEATGELNMTVITIVAVAALLAFFYAVIWPNLQAGMTLSSACSAANGQEYKVQNEDGSKIDCKNDQCTYTTKSGKATSRTCKDNK
jgi:hypothetical protein